MITRYHFPANFYGRATVRPDGGYVRFEDYDTLRAELAALWAENEALRDDCSRLASYNAEESAHLRTRAEKAEAERDALRAAVADIEMHTPHDYWCSAMIDVESDEHPIEERCDCSKMKLRAVLKECE